MKGFKHSEETKQKMRDAVKLRLPISEETRKKLSESHKGKITWMKNRKHSEETRNKISTSLKGNVPWNKGTKGLYKHTEESKKKLSKSLMGHVGCVHGIGYKNGGSFQKGFIPWNKGGKFPQFSGENSSSWKGGINYVIARRARLRGATGIHTKKQWEDLKKFYNYMCLCCKQQEPFIKLSEDHIMPLSLGGSNDIENIQPLCMSCNFRKHAKFVDYRLEYGKTITSI